MQSRAWFRPDATLRTDRHLFRAMAHTVSPIRLEAAYLCQHLSQTHFSKLQQTADQVLSQRLQRRQHGLGLAIKALALGFHEAACFLIQFTAAAGSVLGKRPEVQPGFAAHTSVGNTGQSLFELSGRSQSLKEAETNGAILGTAC